MLATFAALAEPHRFEIVELLRAGPLPVSDITLRLELRQPQVSKHLSVLKQAGLVAVQPRAQQRLYRLDPRPLRELDAWLARYRQCWEARLDALEQRLKQLAPKTPHSPRQPR